MVFAEYLLKIFRMIVKQVFAEHAGAVKIISLRLDKTVFLAPYIKGKRALYAAE